MKLKHIINGFWAFSFCLAGCVDPDDLVRTESEITEVMRTLSMKPLSIVPTVLL